MSLTVLLFLACVAPVAVADMWFSSPASGPFPVLLRSKFLGIQATDLVLSNASVSVLEGLTPLHPGHVANCDKFRDTITLLESEASDEWRAHDEFSTSLALQLCGAKAVVIPFDGVKTQVGFDFLVTDTDCCKSRGHEVTIPVLQVWEGHTDHVFRAVAQGAPITATVDSVNPNPWLSAFEHPAFVVFARVLPTVANVVVVLFALRAICLQVCALRLAKTRQALFNKRQLMILALVLHIFGCILRAVYCAMGPFFSNDSLALRDNLVLRDISLVVQFPVICVVSFVFLRIIAMRRNPAPPRTRNVALVALACVVVALLEGFGDYEQLKSHDRSFFELFASIVEVGIIAGSTVLFLVGGVPFLYRLRASTKQFGTPHGASAVVRAKFARTVVYGTIGLLVQLACTIALLVLPNVVFTPIGWCTLHILYFWGLTATAFFHTLAFTPSARAQPCKIARPANALWAESKYLGHREKRDGKEEEAGETHSVHSGTVQEKKPHDDEQVAGAV